MNTIGNISQKDFPIFYQKWWLDLVCGKGQYHILEDSYKGKVFGYLPVCEKKKFGFTYSFNPLLTPYSGPYFHYRDNLLTREKRSGEDRITEQWNAELKNLDLLDWNLHPSVQNWFPFYKQGFRQRVKATFIINQSTPNEALSQMKPQLRNVLINKTADFPIKTDIEDALCIDFVLKHAQNKSYAGYIDKELLKAIFNHPNITDYLLKYAVFNTNGALDSLALVLRDEKYHYLWFNVRSENSDSNANSMVLWTAIQAAIQEGKKFDFEGSLIPGVEKYFRGFGGELMTYHRIYKTNHWILKWRNRLMGI